MRRSGRISLVGAFSLLAVLLVAVLLLFGKPGPGAAGGEFMDALARGDVKKLSELSYFSKPPSASEVENEWHFATDVSGKHYNFMWRITATTVTGDTASVKLGVTRNFGTPASYEENYALPMRLVNGEWKVDVTGISREMYPGLPTGNGNS